jgi:hypothetical protein
VIKIKVVTASNTVLTGINEENKYKIKACGKI